MSHRVCGSRPVIQLLATAISVIAVAPVVLVGQSPAMVVGKVTAETGMALMGADVAIDGTLFRAITNDRGEFRLPGVPAGPIEVRARRLGFRPDAVKINVPASGTETVSITLAVAAQDLRPVMVRGQSVRYTGRLAGYYERLERRIAGVFITREQIEHEHPRTLGQLLQRTPGITTLRQRDGSVGVRMRDRTCS
ncbi:MAG TPA: TonB-dependent receptor, partial [Gemmatimonadaceae bacterium]|nr:TonB-dependent receptor [Gemmatimonadaceae bacterium]